MQNITLPEKIVIITVIVLMVVLSGGAYYAYNHFRPVQAQDEPTPQSLIESVSKIAELPSEQPTIATVTDKEKLAHFSFFSQAQLGDKVLIFNEAKKAYLYRPSTDKIIEVGPIMITENEQTPNPLTEVPEPESTVAAVQTGPATVTLLNGTKGKGVALKAEKELAAAGDLSIEIKTKANSKNNYQQTQIAVLTETAKETAAKIAQLFNAQIVELPKGELKPTTEIVVFLGTDRL